jgi:hypothetical protein
MTGRHVAEIRVDAPRQRLGRSRLADSLSDIGRNRWR